MTLKPVTDLADSLGRCLNNPDFFPFIFDSLVRAQPDIKPVIDHLGKDAFRLAIRKGLTILLLDAAHHRHATEAIKQMKAQHGPDGLSVRKEWFDQFHQCVLAALRKCDPEFTGALDVQWDTALKRGIAKMRS